MNAISKLLETGRYSKKDLLTIYRYLCKHTHPDTAGGDGSAFLKVRETYAKALSRFDTPGAAAGEFDPYEIPRQLEHGGDGTPRSRLYACLGFYLALGLQSFKVRSSPSLKERNEKVLRSVAYWANLYDPKFVKIFAEFNRQVIQPMASTVDMKNYTYAKRAFHSGLQWFFLYRETGRDSCRTMARDKLASSIFTMEKYLRRDDPILPFARWLLAELDTAELDTADT
jgi:hypothetical protein